MNRREALASTAALLGVTLYGSQAFLSGCTNPEKSIAGFSPDVVSLLDEVGEVIIPATPGVPGAKAARIGEFMKVMVTDCYDKEEQSIFLDGLNILEKTSQQEFDKEFMALNPEQKVQLLTRFDAEARKSKDTKHFFNMINQLTVWGYFSSEPGATKALRYVPVPGRYEGCVDYREGDGAWS